MLRLRIVVPVLVSLLVVTVVTSSAQAQRPGGRPGLFGRGGGGGAGGYLGLLRVEAVQKEIELVEDQLAEIRKFGEQLRDQFPQPDVNFRELSQEEREKLIAEMRERGQKAEKAAKEKLADLLLPHQLKRLRQISVQVQGAAALGDEEVAAELKLTDQQKRDIERVGREAREEIGGQVRELFQGGNREGAGEKLAELRKKAENKVLALLTDAQKKQFEEMKGEAFDMPRPDFGGGRRGQGQGESRGRRPAGDN